MPYQPRNRCISCLSTRIGAMGNPPALRTLNNSTPPATRQRFPDLAPAQTILHNPSVNIHNPLPTPILYERCACVPYPLRTTDYAYARPLAQRNAAQAPRPPVPPRGTRAETGRRRRGRSAGGPARADRRTQRVARAETRARPPRAPQIWQSRLDHHALSRSCSHPRSAFAPWARAAAPPRPRSGRPRSGTRRGRIWGTRSGTRRRRPPRG